MLYRGDAGGSCEAWVMIMRGRGCILFDEQSGQKGGKARWGYIRVMEREP